MCLESCLMMLCEEGLAGERLALSSATRGEIKERGCWCPGGDVLMGVSVSKCGALNSFLI